MNTTGEELSKLRSFDVLCKLLATILATSYVSDASRMQRVRQAARLVAVAESLPRLRQTALCNCRSCRGRSRADSRETRDARKIALALSRTLAAAQRCRAGFVGRRRDTVATIKQNPRRVGCRSLDQRRVRQSDAEFQSARNERRGFNGEISRREE